MEHEHAFLAPILMPQGGMYHHRLLLPDEVADDLHQRSTRRVIGTMNGDRFDLALHKSKDEGITFLGMSRGRLRALKVGAGDLIEVELSADPDPDHVEPGPELAAALDTYDDAREAWARLTPGRRRSVAWTVNSAKRESTRQSRAAETARRLADGTHPALHPRR